MISRQNLQNKIEAIIGLKEELVPLLNRHITSAISFSGLERKDQDEVSERLRSMAVEQQRHKELLQGIKDSVIRSKSNAY